LSHDIKKEAGAAGGESGARTHGPALGGEAGSVLMGKLNRKVLPYANHPCRFRDHRWRIRYGYPLQCQPIAFWHKAESLRRVFPQIITSR
jgi:hypothetical protein